MGELHHAKGLWPFGAGGPNVAMDVSGFACVSCLKVCQTGGAVALSLNGYRYGSNAM